MFMMLEDRIKHSILRIRKQIDGREVTHHYAYFTWENHDFLLIIRKIEWDVNIGKLYLIEEKENIIYVAKGPTQLQVIEAVARWLRSNS
jgi:transketolase C-terminal domain/subunit